MAPSTVTETIEQFYETSKELKLSHQKICDSITNYHSNDIKVTNSNSNVKRFTNSDNSGVTQPTNQNDTNDSKTPYEECLLRSNEWKFMKPIRDWERKVGFVTPIIWSNSIAIIALHLISTLWFLWEVFFILPKWQSVLFAVLMGQMAGFGVTGGAHRFWCHRSFKAKKPLQLILLFCYSVAGQNTIYEWVRDHRVHHKFSETSADPHDAHRGFFFSHVGWLMMKKHPDVIREGRKMDLSDVLHDPLVQFHTRYFTLFKVVFCFALPTLIPWLAWSESFRMSFLSQALVRYVMSLNFTWSVNSFAHLWGTKPYDRHVMPSENLGVSIVAMGEGWHNYHHTFPWDYKASELGMTWNVTTILLDYFARIGWAYDLKVASPTLVEQVAKNRGDGSMKTKRKE